MAKQLRFDGVYHYVYMGRLHYLLRFYEDGKVWSGYTTLHPNAPGAAVTENTYGFGKYTLENKTVKFTISIPEGNIHYEGKLSGNRLRFTVISEATHSRMKWVFEFLNT